MFFIILLVLVGGAITFFSWASHQPGAMMTVTTNGVEQTMPAIPFSAAPYIGYAMFGAFSLAFIIGVFQMLYWSLFRFTMREHSVSVRSGIIFTQEKEVQYDEMQSTTIKRGPLLALFGLGHVVGYTSSPQQLVVASTGRGGTRTTHRPDVSLYLLQADAQQLHAQVRSSIPQVAITP
jgi:uncharacterized membrane protein YdbT with pleckstrin-like domain